MLARIGEATRGRTEIARIALSSVRSGSKTPSGCRFEKPLRPMVEFDAEHRYRKWGIDSCVLFFCRMVRPSTTLFLIEGLRHESSLLR